MAAGILHNHEVHRNLPCLTVLVLNGIEVIGSIAVLIVQVGDSHQALLEAPHIEHLTILKPHKLPQLLCGEDGVSREGNAGKGVLGTLLNHILDGKLVAIIMLVVSDSTNHVKDGCIHVSSVLIVGKNGLLVHLQLALLEGALGKESSSLHGKEPLEGLVGHHSISHEADFLDDGGSSLRYVEDNLNAVLLHLSGGGYPNICITFFEIQVSDSSLVQENPAGIENALCLGGYCLLQLGGSDMAISDEFEAGDKGLLHHGEFHHHGTPLCIARQGDGTDIFKQIQGIHPVQQIQVQLISEFLADEGSRHSTQFHRTDILQPLEFDVPNLLPIIPGVRGLGKNHPGQS